MQRILIIMCLGCVLSSCSAETFLSNSSKTKDFFVENLRFTRPENIYDDKVTLPANIATVRNAKQKRKQISYDPYYPYTKPWNNKPKAVGYFE